jgi:hypothetical protein
MDAEYNGFGGELISIALVPEDEAAPSFYEAVGCVRPIQWVVEHVLPVLQVAPISHDELTNRFAAYLHNDDHPILVADWPEDISHAALLLVTGPGHMKPIRTVQFRLVDPERLDMGAHEHVASTLPHNARHDANALREAVLGYEQRTGFLS